MSEVKYLSTTGTQTLVNKIKDYVDNKEVSATIEDGSITTSKLANSAVTASKIAYKTITDAEIGDGTIVPKLLADSVGPIIFDTSGSDSGTLELSNIYIHGDNYTVNFSQSGVPSIFTRIYNYYQEYTTPMYIKYGDTILAVTGFQVSDSSIIITGQVFPIHIQIYYQFSGNSWSNNSKVQSGYAVTSNHNDIYIAEGVVDTNTISNDAVTPAKLSDEARYFPAVASTNSSTTLLVGNFNNLGTISSNTTVTLDTPTIDSSSLPDDYTCVWEGGFTKSSGCTVTFPSDITWVGDTLESSSTGDWEFSIRKIGSSYHGILVNFS